MAFRASALRSAWSRVHFPRQTVTLVRSAGPDKGIFKVDPKMTKLEVREYLEKVYGLPVRKVNTTNYDGKLKRVPGRFYALDACVWADHSRVLDSCVHRGVEAPR